MGFTFKDGLVEQAPDAIALEDACPLCDGKLEPLSGGMVDAIQSSPFIEESKRLGLSRVCLSNCCRCRGVDRAGNIFTFEIPESKKPAGAFDKWLTDYAGERKAAYSGDREVFTRKDMQAAFESGLWSVREQVPFISEADLLALAGGMPKIQSLGHEVGHAIGKPMGYGPAFTRV